MSLLTSEDILFYTNKLKTYKEAYDLPWKIFMEKKLRLEKCPHLRIVILNAPCNGFGDIIFASKLRDYLVDWYACNETYIATTRGQDFKKLGTKESTILDLVGRKEKASTTVDCRRFQNLRLKKAVETFDLIFVAPLQADFEINPSDIKAIFPYSNYFNTFFFSEYNDVINKRFDFATGIGSSRMGLMLTDTEKYRTEITGIENHYVVAYIAETITRSTKCYLSFLEMIAKKYSAKYNYFDVIVPAWIEKEMRTEHIQNKMKKILKYYPIIKIIGNEYETILVSKNIEENKVLNIRGDILPVPNRQMIALIENSEADVLLTGDQSITDALSCCSDKNIFYQIAPWKENFAHNLAKELPQEYLKKKTTSCGTIKAVNYKSNFRKFVEKWDFRKLAKPKMDAIMLSAVERKHNIDLQIYENFTLISKNLRSLKTKITELLRNID